MKEIQEVLMFVNPVYVVDDVCIENIDKIYQEAVGMWQKEVGINASNYGGWHSKRFENPPIEEYPFISSLILEIKEAVYNIYNLWQIKKSPSLESFWVNINKKNDFNLNHCHPGSLFSGVYYVDYEKDSGKIVFIRPDTYQHYFSGKAEKNQYTYEKFTFDPQIGRSFIFPSYVDHYVEPNLNDKERISIAFNFS